MKIRPKGIIGSIVGVVVGAIVLAFIAYQSVRTKLIPDLYAQWASAEMVVACRKKLNRMPIDWEELAPFYESDSLHHGGLSFEQIRQRIIIDFSELPKLELDYANRVVPEIIRTASGTQSHWAGAEPNQLVNHELRK